MIEETVSTSVKLEGSVNINELEAQLYTIYRKYGVPETLCIDMRNCDYIELVCLVYFLSLLKQRESNNVKTIFRLPTRKSVRDFMRLWEFPNAVREVTGKSFNRFVYVKDVQNYFGENSDGVISSYENMNLYLSTGIERLLSNKFFALNVLKSVCISSKKYEVRKEAARWKETLIKSVLINTLKGPHSYIRSRVIFESMTNAIRHSNSSCIVSGSVFQGAKDGMFTITYWDDGRGMVSSLKNALLKDLPIRYGSEKDYPLFNASYLVNFYQEKDGKEILNSSYRIESKMTPTVDATDDVILVSTLFAGITCDTQGELHIVDGEEEESDYRDNKEIYDKYSKMLGMGHSFLLNTVVDIFHGEVCFRSGKYFMNISFDSNKKHSTKYTVKIVEFSELIPEFLGNHISIRIPIRVQ